MKKYLLSAFALPLLFACSSEDLTEQEVISNDQFAGIEKVDATFSMDEGVTRMATEWSLEEGDRYGFAWLTDKYEGFTGTVKVTQDGSAFQNHPLTQTGSIFKPATSIYVGKYFLYRPYDESVVSPAVINFTLANQKLANDASEKHNGAPYQALAASAIIIGDKWTDVTPDGRTVGGTTWDEPGIDKKYELYAALFSNRTALDLTYLNNNPKFATATRIQGATDIDFTYAKDEEVGAVDIKEVTVDLQRTGSISANVFTYGPDKADKEPVKADGITGDDHNGEFWANKSNVATTYGFNFTAGAITLTPDAAINTGNEGSKGWFWFNSLPVTAGDAALTDKVVTTYETTFGKVTIDDTDGSGTAVTLANVAYARETPSTGTKKEWIKFGADDDETKATDKKIWTIAAANHNTFVNQYGNHVGKYALTVDFSKCVMNGMHIENDEHLQKALKYYIASGKDETVVLNLDGDANKEFKLSKISIALLQTINASTKKVTVQGCSTHNNPVKVIVTQEGSAGKTEVPELNNVFETATDVYLASGTTWTWSGGGETAGWDEALTIDDKVSSITNEGTLTVNATNVELSVAASTLANAKGATMNITKVTTVKNALTNLGTINVGDNTEDGKKAELRAYNVEITNDAKDKLMPADLIAATVPATAEVGLINNYGVVGVSDIGSSGKFNNYGLIDVKDANAITLLTTNQVVTDFDDAFNATNNKMGTVNLPSPTALVSVNNKAANGFILYNWPAATPTYVTPEGNVKYNTIVVSGNIEFTENETEIQYIVFDGSRTQVINKGYLVSLKGVIVNADKSIIIEKGNTLAPSQGTFLGAGATVYKGGVFTHNAKPVSGTTVSNYFGNWETTQIVKF